MTTIESSTAPGLETKMQELGVELSDSSARTPHLRRNDDRRPSTAADTRRHRTLPSAITGCCSRSVGYRVCLQPTCYRNVRTAGNFAPVYPGGHSHVGCPISYSCPPRVSAPAAGRMGVRRLGIFGACKLGTTNYPFVQVG